MKRARGQAREPNSVIISHHRHLSPAASSSSLCLVLRSPSSPAWVFPALVPSRAPSQALRTSLKRFSISPTLLQAPPSNPGAEMWREHRRQETLNLLAGFSCDLSHVSTRIKY
ncbi:hypothetical protein, variant [Blastomyces dermatitidis ER-3]|uniref:Uncharacterized protein n=2 Tax=Ajellomyces dermatitidis TaxID=5039 RepID=A0A0J9EQN7_AJEDA|nr:uncharacterized protein BDCG_09353 [Blastomyces dermatitidis ER-3]XP_045282914.1 hypothetical protein, variant [Blastomyces dermatitidis ER-3]KMW68577.1 hypothetical protein BDDG_12901 [Blastomyces dermatitidis ATCC 18188]KMW68578.1 hypothetical protein, variant [Blastomyces dermatitidis ATCC 18188]OAT03186.1 hypothetical protein BDCG_09353 [Blastomyces dermatitidis ER-3]OAT03187.1 hypothetical protein, variant [Blastomyces dermatitidis ER-3]